MAERRMFAKAIIGSGRFLRMPPSTRLLYYDLGMFADDDGVVEAFTVMRQTGATEDDLRVLVTKGFVTILNEELVALITDWKVNNLIKNDRYKPSIYKDLLIKVQPEPDVLPSGAQLEPKWNPSGTQVEPQVRLGKDRISKVSKGNDIGGSEPSKYELKLNDNTTFGVTETYISELQELYQAVNVDTEIRKMVGWCDSHTAQRKTRRGIKAFITSWLAREQDRGGSYAGSRKTVAHYARLGEEV